MFRKVESPEIFFLHRQKVDESCLSTQAELEGYDFYLADLSGSRYCPTYLPYGYAIKEHPNNRHDLASVFKASGVVGLCDYDYGLAHLTSHVRFVHCGGRSGLLQLNCMGDKLKSLWQGVGFKVVRRERHRNTSVNTTIYYMED